MLIDFEKINPEIIKNFKGGEKEALLKIYQDEKNKIICGTLVPGASIGLHTHETNSEIIYILEGKGQILFDGQYQNLNAGICHYCPKGHSHSLINNSEQNLIFFAVVPEQ